MDKFKVGQRVRIVNCQYLWLYTCEMNGLTGEIIEDRGGRGLRWKLKFDNGMDFSNNNIFKDAELDVIEENKQMFNKGDKVKVSGCTGSKEKYNGKTGEYLENRYPGDVYKHTVSFDGAGTCSGWAFADSELTKVPQLTIGSKVTVKHNSGAMEFVDGTLKPTCSVVYEDIGMDTAIYEITSVIAEQHILRRISDQRIFFVHQRFLKEYVVKPKFKQGQIVESRMSYYRIAKVNNDLTYVITSTPHIYSEGKAAVAVKESELTEVSQ